jgi:hypothetical protein
MKKQRQKQYPMDGPSLEAQRKMEQPQKNRAWLRHYFKSRSNMRPETVAVLDLR